MIIYFGDKENKTVNSMEDTGGGRVALSLVKHHGLIVNLVGARTEMITNNPTHKVTFYIIVVNLSW